MTSPLIGAWQGGPEGYQGQIVFSEAHYTGLFITDGRELFQSENPSETEEAAAYRALAAGAGTYELSGSTLTLNAEYDRIPRTQSPSSYKATIEGDSLTVESLSRKWRWNL